MGEVGEQVVDRIVEVGVVGRIGEVGGVREVNVVTPDSSLVFGEEEFTVFVSSLKDWQVEEVFGNIF